MDRNHNTENDISMLSLAWLRIVKYWKWIAGFAAAIIGMILLKGSREGKVLKNARESHKSEIKVIEDSLKTEKEEKANALKKFEKTIKKIEEDFQVREEEINEEKRDAIKKLITSSPDDPEKITEELAKILSVDFVKRK